MARGDHIRVRRWRGLYSHHGIDMGDGTVIHLSGEPLRARHATVCRSDLASFLAGGEALLVRYPRECRSADEAAAAAEAALAKAGYCLWRNNCEHFATACKTGRAQSRQVLRAIWASGATAGAACVLAVSVATILNDKRLATRRPS